MRTPILLMTAVVLSLPLLAGCSYHDHDDHYGRRYSDALYCDDAGYAGYSEYRHHRHYGHRDRHHDGHRRHRGHSYGGRDYR